VTLRKQAPEILKKQVSKKLDKKTAVVSKQENNSKDGKPALFISSKQSTLQQISPNKEPLHNSSLSKSLASIPANLKKKLSVFSAKRLSLAKKNGYLNVYSIPATTLVQLAYYDYCQINNLPYITKLSKQDLRIDCSSCCLLSEVISTRASIYGIVSSSIISRNNTCLDLRLEDASFLHEAVSSIILLSELN